LKAIVTGASGFIGGHLTRHLAKEGHDVTAWTRGADVGLHDPTVSAARVDVLDAAAVAAAIAVADADVIFHLAAQSLPPRSWSVPVETMRINVEGAINILEAVRAREGRRPRILLAGSSAQYATGSSGHAIGEEAPMRADSPYAISKVAADQFAELYARAFDLDIVRFRPFAWIGPGKTGDAASDFARRIVDIERGAPPRLVVGRTDTARDFIDVRDGVDALLLLADKGKPGQTYNICRGAGTTIGEILAAFRDLAKVPFEVVQDPSLLRPVDEKVRIGDPERIFGLGWRPRIPLAQSVHDILVHWRERTRC